MTHSCRWLLAAVAALSVLTPNTASAQLMSTCVADSPERRGEIGCSVSQTKLLPREDPDARRRDWNGASACSRRHRP